MRFALRARRSIFLGIVLCLGGCAMTPERIEKQVVISGVDFDTHIQYTGPVIHSMAGASTPEERQRVRLFAERNKSTDELRYYILADVLYPSGFRYYNSVMFANTDKLRPKTLWFAELPCVTEVCGKSSSVRFPVELSRLFKHQKLVFKLQTITGLQNYFSIPRAYIEGFVLATKRHAASATRALQAPLLSPSVVPASPDAKRLPSSLKANGTD